MASVEPHATAVAMLHIEDIDRFVFIVGAPRSGTTTMARWLQHHPQVLFPFVKEPHFFAQYDLRGLAEGELRRRVEDDFLDRFYPPAEAGRDVGADCSVSYLYTPEQLEPVLKLWPNSRFIVSVRDPLTLLPSLHKRLIFTGDESLRRFEDAWAAVPDRAAGRRIPWSTIDPRLLRYDEVARYATYIERLYAAVGKERCMVMVFDDLLSDPAGQHRRLLDFAGLEAMAPPEMKAERSGKGVRYLFLQQLLNRPPRFLLPYLTTVRFQRRFDKEAGRKDGETDLGSRSKSLRKRILAWNRAPDDKRPVPLAVQRAIQTHFQSEVDRLGELIGRDLDGWLKPRE